MVSQTLPNGYGPIASRIFLAVETLADAKRDKQFRGYWLHKAVEPTEYERVMNLPVGMLRDMYAPVYENGPHALRWLSDMHIIQRALLGFEGRDPNAREWLQDRFALYDGMPNLTADERHEANISLRKIAGESWVRLTTVPENLRELNEPRTLETKYGVTVFSADFSAKLEWFSYISLMHDVISGWDSRGFSGQHRYRRVLDSHTRLVADLRARADRFEH